MADVADQLRQAIKQSGKTRYRISQQSGISEAVLSRFASGQTDLTLANVNKLCAAMGLQIVLQPKNEHGTKKLKKRQV